MALSPLTTSSGFHLPITTLTQTYIDDDVPDLSPRFHPPPTSSDSDSLTANLRIPFPSHLQCLWPYVPGLLLMPLPQICWRQKTSEAAHRGSGAGRASPAPGPERQYPAFHKRMKTPSHTCNVCDALNWRGMVGRMDTPSQWHELVTG